MNENPLGKVTGIIARQAKNTNELRNNKFTFSLFKFPEFSWKTVSSNIPALALPVALQRTNLNPIPRSGLTIEFSTLKIEFRVDEDLNSYIEILNWMILTGMPVSSEGYKKLKWEDKELSPDGKLVSDGLLTVLSNSSIPNLYVYFKDVFPVSMTEISFRNDVEGPELQTCTVEFAYTWFSVESVNDPNKGDQ